MHYLQSYDQLKSFFLRYNRKYSSLNPLTINARAALGCALLGRKIETLHRFTTNRYFIDSVGIDEVPRWQDIDLASVNNEICFSHGFSRGELDATEEQFLLKIAECLLKRFGETGANIDRYNHFWTQENRDFFETNGYVLIEDFFDKDTADYYRAEAVNIAQIERASEKGFFYGYQNKGQRVYNLIDKTSAYDEMLSNSVLDMILRDIFSRPTLHRLYNMASWHANILKPGAAAQKVHTDLALPSPLPDWIVRANVNFIFEDYTEKNGATIFLPGSHKFKRHPTDEDLIKFKDDFVPLNAKRGSVAIWSGHTWHRSGQNNSNSDRVALLACYASTYILEAALEENHPAIISKERAETMPEHLQNLFILNHGLKGNVVT